MPPGRAAARPFDARDGRARGPPAHQGRCARHEDHRVLGVLGPPAGGEVPRTGSGRGRREGVSDGRDSGNGAGGVTRVPFNRSATVVAAAAMLVAITSALFVVNDVREGLGFLYAVPIAVVASRFGRAPGLFTAGLAFAPFVVWGQASEVELMVTAFIVRALTYVFVAAVVGAYAERLQSLSRVHSRLIESAPDAILRVDARGRIELANEKACELFGWSVGELVGTTIEELMPDRFRVRHLERRDAYARQPRTRQMGEGLPLYGLRRDGTE